MSVQPNENGALMTSYGHNMTMRQVRIAELKSRLSEYLRAVRRGETIAVLDRDTPVAQLVPVREGTGLRIRKPASGSPTPNRVPLPKPAKLKVDVVELLLEEREGLGHCVRDASGLAPRGARTAQRTTRMASA